jgi:hypothetical protein
MHADRSPSPLHRGIARLRRAPRKALFGAMLGAAVLALPAIALSAGKPPKSVTFSMFPQNALINCLKPSPGSPAPTVSGLVTRGKLADQLTLNLAGFKPGLDFDLFTIQNSPQKADGSPVSPFPGFGLAWYQSDVHVASDGTGKVQIKTILLDQIFGVDTNVGLTPINTFHVGFWFNNPADAAGCGFTGSTPFNGEHNAGPLAFVTRPDAATNLGPLCSPPDATQPSGCDA